MGVIANFKMPKIDLPKIDKSILPSSSDFINTDQLNNSIDDIKSKLDFGKFDISSMGNPKDEAVKVLQSIPKIGNFSLMSLVPSQMLDSLDTEKITKDINSKLSEELDMGELGSFQLPSDVGTMAKDVISGKGIDFSSLYKMPTNNPFDTSSYSLGSDFDIDELMSEAEMMTDAASNEFDIDKYLKEFEDIGV